MNYIRFHSYMFVCGTTYMKPYSSCHTNHITIHCQSSCIGNVQCYGQNAEVTYCQWPVMAAVMQPLFQCQFAAYCTRHLNPAAKGWRSPTQP